MKYAKAIAAAVGTVATALTAAFADDVLNLDEIGSLVSVALAAGLSVYAVWRVPNTPEA